MTDVVGELQRGEQRRFACQPFQSGPGAVPAAVIHKQNAAVRPRTVPAAIRASIFLPDGGRPNRQDILVITGNYQIQVPAISSIYAGGMCPTVNNPAARPPRITLIRPASPLCRAETIIAADARIGSTAVGRAVLLQS